MVASGEQVTAGLLAIVLQTMGVQARSWQGWQIPIITDDAHGAARITRYPPATKLMARLEQGEVAVIAGFQGVDPERNRISTLGRGGSDTSAVAVAAAVRRDRCDIYTDVDGVYTTDPRIVPKARRLRQDLLRGDAGDGLARAPRCCRPARSSSPWYTGCACGCSRASMRRTRCSRHGRELGQVGTIVCDEEEIVEKKVVSGIAYAGRGEDHAPQVADKPGVAARIFGPLADANINVDMIVQNMSEDGKLHRHDVHRAGKRTRRARSRS